MVKWQCTFESIKINLLIISFKVINYSLGLNRNIFKIFLQINLYGNQQHFDS